MLKRLTQYRLRTLLIGVSCLSVGAALVGHKWQQCRARDLFVAYVQSWGGEVDTMKDRLLGCGDVVGVRLLPDRATWHSKWSALQGGDMAVFMGKPPYTEGSSANDREMARIGGQPSIERLELAFLSISDTGMWSLRRLDRLREIDVSSTSVTNAGLAHLKECVDLRSIRVDNTECTCGVVAVLSSNRIERLSFCGTPSSSDDVQGIKVKWAVKELRLGGTRIDDRVLDVIKDMPSLEILDIGASGVSGRGLGALLGLTKLRALKLDGSGVNDECIAVLVELGSLESVSLKRTKVTASGLNELKRNRPDIRVSHDVVGEERRELRFKGFGRGS